jgi:hypothetical protein
LNGGQQGTDYFFAKDNQGGEGLQTSRSGLVVPRFPDPFRHLLSAKLLEIVGGLSTPG